MLQKLKAKIGIRTRLRAAKARAREKALYRKYQLYTMIKERDFVANVRTAARILQKPELRKGAIVECGCWRGGMSAALVEVGGSQRDYYFFDSFEGLPPARIAVDGQRAIVTQADPNYHNCAASIDEFRKTIELTQCPIDRIHTVKGFYENTLPGFKLPPIALLRLDADWYDSTMTCLNALWDSVVEGGAILIDDYYTWEGCSRAVHDFLSARKARERIFQESTELAVIIRQLQ